MRPPTTPDNAPSPPIAFKAPREVPMIPVAKPALATPLEA
nr:MAG TPA: hypothetical protein [Bacteriophage sp.]